MCWENGKVRMGYVPEDLRMGTPTALEIPLGERRESSDVHNEVGTSSQKHYVTDQL